MTEWGSVEVLLGDGQGGFPTRHLYQLQKKNPVGLAVADLNADGRPDVVTTNYGFYDAFVSVLLGNGDGTLSYDVNSSNFATGRNPMDVAVGDFTSDGIPDLVTISHAAGASLTVLPGRGDGTFAARIGTSAYVGNSLVGADFNGDGRLDIFMAPVDEELPPPGKLFLGHGDGTFELPEDVDIGGYPTGSPDAGDFNGDGRPDLAIGVTYDDYVTNAVAVLLNDGNWLATSPTLPGDYNGNGVVDAADYVVWRKMLGSSVPNYSGADGSGNGVVDQEDQTVWRAHFGETLPAVGAGSLVAAAPAITPELSASVQSVEVTERASASVEPAEPDERGSIEPHGTIARDSALAVLHSRLTQFIPQAKATMRSLHALPTTKSDMKARGYDLLLVPSAATMFDPHIRTRTQFTID